MIRETARHRDDSWLREGRESFVGCTSGQVRVYELHVRIAMMGGCSTRLTVQHQHRAPVFVGSGDRRLRRFGYNRTHSWMCVGDGGLYDIEIKNNRQQTKLNSTYGRHAPVTVQDRCRCSFGPLSIRLMAKFGVEPSPVKTKGSTNTQMLGYLLVTVLRTSINTTLCYSPPVIKTRVLFQLIAVTWMFFEKQKPAALLIA